ncbi:3-methyl-2-oxobutanoate hydroxymethyltransferase [Sphingomonas sp. BIUV-7]|uniref:3-methyl-2-oxobutanoate hydroxymethyltransferase n=1 Tax=Sphingomonas natans TaxID=3063330 RepID=A0ABT8Y9Z6_9SPHN|nr:3-methyl-2-oxobutanoate hydroxymethyltransferase [Sphingomonas sp. BIUV-7]MDO6415145.1 3-methyl-2-oxobutanoate hydroxymethyltransferase [Sphingomonas sp. BIUV-7]
MALTVAGIIRMKAKGERIAMITCYDHASALICERAGLRFLLVGDSLGQVMLGHTSTIPVTLEDMIAHSAAVARGAPESLIVVDMPFLSYATPEQAVASAQRLMQDGGAHAVKLEGGEAVLPAVERLVSLGVPVMGHLGFTPQSANQIGIRVQAKTAEAGATLIRDARALEQAGAFAMVLELVPIELARAVSEAISIPTIGIGAGPGCDGQVQVWHDVLGLIDHPPFRHAGRYAEIGKAIESALAGYAADVASGAFPTDANGASIDASVIEEAKRLADVAR